MADELVPAQAVPEVAAPAPAVETAPAAPLAEQITTATSATPEVPSGEPAAAAAVPAEWQGVRDFARANGVELPFDNDVQALQALLQAQRQSQERNFYADLGRRVAPQSQQFAEFLRGQQAQANAPKAPPAWQGPEFDKKWLNLVEKDPETGELRSKAGYDPAIAEKVTKYAEWRESFLESPEKVIAPLIEERARQLIDARFAEQSERSLADNLVARNAAWMFQADAQGQPVFTQQGQRQLTPEGVLYARAADQLWKSGLRDVRQIDAVSRGQVENAVLRQRLLALQPAAAPATTVAAAATDPSVGGQGTRPSAPGPAAPQSQAGLSLRERLMVNLDRAGVPDNVSL